MDEYNSTNWYSGMVIESDLLNKAENQLKILTDSEIRREQELLQERKEQLSQNPFCMSGKNYQWSVGAYSASKGTVTTSDLANTRLYMPGYLDDDIYKIEVFSNKVVMILGFDSNNTYQGCYNGQTFTKEQAYYLTNTIELPSNYQYKINIGIDSGNINTGYENPRTNSNLEDIIFYRKSNNNNILFDQPYIKVPQELTFTKGNWNNSGDTNGVTSTMRTQQMQLNYCVVEVDENYYLKIGEWENNTFSSGYKPILKSFRNVRSYEFQPDPEKWYCFAIQKSDGSALQQDTEGYAEMKEHISIYNCIPYKNLFIEEIDNKINMPISGTSGTEGLILTSTGGKYPIWAPYEHISGEDITSAVNSYINDHPSVLSTVEDHSLGESKFSSGALRYITPEMFDAQAYTVGSTEIQDTHLQQAIDFAIGNHIPILDGRGRTYLIGGSTRKEWMLSGGTSPVNLYGLSIAGSLSLQNITLKLKDGATPGTNILFLDCVPGQRIILDNVYIDGNKANQSSNVLGDGNMSGIKIGAWAVKYNNRLAGNITIKNCYITDCYTDCIIASSCTYDNLLIENCVLKDAGRNGITDNAINDTVRNCYFRNNGRRTAPFWQYLTESERIDHYNTKIIENCIFDSSEKEQDSNLTTGKYNDIMFLLKMDTDNDTGSIEHFIVSNCYCKTISIQSQTDQTPAIFKHITIKDTNCDTIRFTPNITQGHDAINNNMQIINCNVGSIFITIGNLNLSNNNISNSIDLDLNNLIMTNNFIAPSNNFEFKPVIGDTGCAVIANNIFNNCTANGIDIAGTKNITNNNIIFSNITI